MLDDIVRSGSFKVLSSAPAATPKQVEALADYFGNVPQEYVDLICEATEIEMQHQSGQYIRIWGPAGCVEMDEGYGIRQWIPDAVPIGDDGGGHIIVYTEGRQGNGLYHAGYGNLDHDDAIWVASSLRACLMHGEGIDTF